MIVECDRCYARYRYDESRFQGKPSKKVRCTKCLSVFDVANPAAAGEPVAHALADETYTRRDDPRRTDEAKGKAREPPAERARTSDAFEMPSESNLSLAVIAGPAAGSIFAIEKPRIVIGRESADVVLEDPEISRNHAAIEIFRDRIALVDLNSTNGTFLGEEAVREAVLENQDEFSLGSSTLMLIVTPKG